MGMYVPAPLLSLLWYSPVGRLGLSVCYDLRFPELYQKLTWEMGAQLLLVPSAFTRITGWSRVMHGQAWGPAWVLTACWETGAELLLLVPSAFTRITGQSTPMHGHGGLPAGKHRGAAWYMGA